MLGDPGRGHHAALQANRTARLGQALRAAALALLVLLFPVEQGKEVQGLRRC